MIKQLKFVQSVDQLGITLYVKLNFNLHMDNIFRSVVNQRNTLMRKHFLNFKAKQVYIYSYILLNFKVLIIALLCGCSVVWYLQIKLKFCKKRPLRFFLNDNTLFYEDLLKKVDKVTRRVSRLRILCIEIYKYNKHAKSMFYEKYIQSQNVLETF